MPTFTTSAILLHRATRRPIPNLKVSAWDKDVEVSDHLGTAVSGPDGRFTIAFDTARFADGQREGDTPEVFFIVYQGDQVIHTTEGRLLSDEKAWENAVIELDIPVENLRFGVSGRLVSKKSKAALPGLKVEVWDKDVEINDFLGVAFSDANGGFSLTFSQEQYLDHPIDELPDMFFRVFQQETLVHTTEGKSLKNTAWVEGVVLEIKLEPEQVNPPQPPVFQQKEELFLLSDVKDRTPGEIQTQQPELYARIRTQALQVLGNTVREHFKAASPELQYYIGAIDYTPLAAENTPVTTFIATALKNSPAGAVAQSESQVLLNKWTGPAIFEELLNPATRIVDNVYFGNTLRQADVFRVADFSQLSAAGASALHAEGVDIHLLDQTLLNDYVQRGVLQTGEAERLGFQSNLFQFSTGRLPLYNALVATTNTQGISALEGVSAWKRTDWAELLATYEVDLPEGMDVSRYADTLYKQTELLFPEETVAAQLSTPVIAAFNSHWNYAKVLQAQNDRLFDGRSFTALNNDHVPPEELGQVQAAYDQLQGMVNRYPGLKLALLLNDKNSIDTEKEKELEYRTGRLASFYERHKNIALLDLDLGVGLPDARYLDMDGYGEEEQEMFVENLKTIQRVRSITSDTEHAYQLMEKGYHGAHQIAFEGFYNFQVATGLTSDVAKTYYQIAQHITLHTWTAIGATVDYANAGGLTLMPMVDTASGEVADYLKRLNGYSDFFGNQNYCNCKHCLSIISPAAYFVDLMGYVKQQVNDRFFNPSDPHPLYLKVRRSDLWHLELTCENTHTLIPYLTIINEILEDYVTLHLPGLIDGTRGRYGIEDAVYGAMYRETAVRSFQQPFCLPLLELTAYLKYFNLQRRDIAEAVFAGAIDQTATLARAYFNLSERAATLIGTANINLPFLQHLYGFPIPASEPFVIADTQLLLQAIGISRKELGALIKTTFVTEGVGGLDIRQEISEGNVQPDREALHGVHPAHLDRIHRLQRLSGYTDWTAPELGLLLEQVYAAGLGTRPDISLALLQRLSQLQKRLKLSVFELCALFHTIVPEHFDQLFNAPRLARGNNWDAETLALLPPFRHPGYLPTPRTEEDTRLLNRLQSGLGINDQQLFQLIEQIGPQLHWEPDTKAFRIDTANLSLLYRYALLLTKLKISVADLFSLLATVTPEVVATHGLAEIEKTIDLLDWLEDSGYTLAELTDRYEKPDFDQLAFETSTGIHTGQLLFFADTVFALIEGITEAQSRTVVAANSERIRRAALRTYRLSQEARIPTPVVPPGILLSDEQQVLLQTRIIDFYRNPGAGNVTDSAIANMLGLTLTNTGALMEANPTIFLPVERPLYELAPDFNVDLPLFVPADIPLTGEQALAHVLPFYPGNVLAQMVGTHFNFSSGHIQAFFRLAGLDLGAAETNRTVSAYLHHLESDFRFNEVLRTIHRMTVLYRDALFTPEVLSFIYSPSGRAALRVLDISRPSVVDIRIISLLKTFVRRAGKHFSVLTDVLASFGPDGERRQFGPADTQAENLAALFGVDKSLVHALNRTLDFPSATNAVQALEKMRRCVELCQLLGIGGEFLPRLAGEYFEGMRSAADIMKTTIRLTFDSDAAFQDKFGVYEDRLRATKRDALTDYITRTVSPGEFRNSNDLYHYFLIDTELEPCARISRLVAAISSLQLYVQRCMMNLEQSEDGRLRVHIDPTAALEWEWRKNYRVWEANRKVFLYPENYIEPDLRDDKTPLFKELEQTLLQQEIDAQTVLDAYTQYLKGFEEIAGLQVAGAFHDREEGQDVLHLFATTTSEPPLYYYRTIENIHTEGKGVIYHAWEKLNLQIPVRKVSPVVYLNRLFVFWVEITTRPLNEVEEGTSYFTGYSHKISIKFTSLRQDATWTAPQRLKLNDMNMFRDGDGIIRDILMTPSEVNAIDAWMRWKPFTPPITPVKKFLLSLKKELKDSTLNNPIELGPSLLVDVEIMELFRNIFIPEFEKTPDPLYPDRIRIHQEPIDDYTLQGGLNWDAIYPDATDILTLSTLNRSLMVDFHSLSTASFTDWEYYSLDSADPSSKRVSRNGDIVYFRYNNSESTNFSYPNAARILLNERSAPSATNRIFSLSAAVQTPSLILVNGSLTDFLVETGTDFLYIHSHEKDGRHYAVKRLGTTLSEKLSRKLFTEGVDGLLNIWFQDSELREAELPVSLNDAVTEDDTLLNVGRMDTTGSLGVYYREMFMHIPLLIANHLNSQGKYADAQRWYHYIFDPTSNNTPLYLVGTPEDERRRMEARRVWQYTEFRNHRLETIIEILNNRSAVEAYQQDPFNPHAIARLRLSAYMKSVVMKYIDNLLDWGDHLFAQDTVESINEATMLYVMAQEILGARPAEIGDCDEHREAPLTYETHFASVSTTEGQNTAYFSAYENDRITKKPRPGIALRKSADKTKSGLAIANARKKASDKTRTLPLVTGDTYITVNTLAFTNYLGGTDWNKYKPVTSPQIVLSFSTSMMRQAQQFCIPHNPDLLAYWDRVEDRLYKIRNCMNISGVRRQLALFAPEIDPRLLVRAKAAGISLSDILDSMSGNLPPYRFSFLLAKAKEYAGTVQGLGAALLSSIEKREGEELNNLRMAQQDAVLKMSTQMRVWEIEAAEAGLASLIKRVETVTQRRDYYSGLISQGLNSEESAQWQTKILSHALNGFAAILAAGAGATAGFPQVMGFSFSTPTHSINQTFKDFSIALAMLADISNKASDMAGMKANFTRREEGWQFSLNQTKAELVELEKQLESAEIRVEISRNSLTLHEKSIEHLKEMSDFYRDKFSNLGLYTWHSSTMQRLYREAYNNALTMARLAERAYRFERNEDNSVLLSNNYWDAARAGLLAGELLMGDLRRMELRYMETHDRQMEIDQAFSLTQIDPGALLRLKTEGSCTFTIPELYFDLFYPGQYRRRIKSARLTIPCITGPYTNVSAVLSLTGSKIRKDAKEGEANLFDVPPSRSTTIAASTGQNDSGVFRLDFRDERYMPFEGAGAVESQWNLQLPTAFKTFDYATINDVIIHVSYTAAYDGGLFRQTVESRNARLIGSLHHYLSIQAIPRLFSLRQEFSQSFHRLLQHPVGSVVPIELGERHFPLFLQGRTLVIESAKLVLEVDPAHWTFDDEGTPEDYNLQVNVNGTSDWPGGSFAPDVVFGMPALDISTAVSSGFTPATGPLALNITVAGAGNFATAANPNMIDGYKLKDVYIFFRYRLDVRTE